MTNTIEEYRSKINKHVTQANTAKSQKAYLSKKYKERSDRLKDIEEEKHKVTVARDLLNKSIDSALEAGRDLLEKTTTEILQIVFDQQDYKVSIKLDKHGANHIADVFIVKDINFEQTEIDLRSEGGGVKDIISLAFFVAISQIVGKDNKAPLLLDEPTSAVSSGFSEQTALAIKESLELTNKQSMVITHEREYLPRLIERGYIVSQDIDGLSDIQRI